MSINKEEIKSNIEKELIKLESDIETLRELTKPISPENAIGRVSRMDAINNKTINDASLRQTEDKKKKAPYSFRKTRPPRVWYLY